DPALGVSYIKSLGLPPGAPAIPGGAGSQPAAALGQLTRLLGQEDAPAAVIVTHPDLRFSAPSQGSVLLHKLAAGAALARLPQEEQAGGAEPGGGEQAPPTLLQNMAIYVYFGDSGIPDHFFRTDPEAKLLRIPLPDLEQRQRYLQHIGTRFFGTESPDPSRLALQTEGWMLRKLEQLADLSQREKAGASDFQALEKLYTVGRRVDRWAQVDVANATIVIAKRNRVRGQKEVISEVLDMVATAKYRMAEMIDPDSRKPPLLLFFVGPTGVGKNLLIRELTMALGFGPDQVKILDMSEYRQDHSDQKLIGAPPGYVGFDDGGQLTNHVQEHGFCAVNIDEIEKAHERIHDIWLPVTDGARLTDGKGRTVDFSDACLIFTSNIGSDTVADIPKLPTGEFKRQDVVNHFLDKVAEYFNDDLERPELFNRLKRGMVVFNFIKKSDALDVVKTRLDNLVQATNAKAREIGLPEAEIVFDPKGGEEEKLAHLLLSLVDYQKYGLRDVNTMLEKFVTPRLALEFLEEKELKGKVRMRWDVNNNRITIEKA
ncbi:MAG: AAA family ATPase, partial [Proteobacteria bacterium]|nr:AAA family ATPase [Pseudomonadota bacterium]